MGSWLRYHSTEGARAKFLHDSSRTIGDSSLRIQSIGTLVHGSKDDLRLRRSITARATQVSRWQLQVQRDDNGEFDIVSQVFKDGFETEIVVPPTLKLGSLVRIQGLNSKGNVLGPSDIVEITAQKETPFFTVGNLLILSGIAILVSVIFVVKRRENGSSQNNGQYQLLPVAK